MIIDCDSCAVRGDACGQCVVSVVLGAPPEGIELDETERRAVAVLAAGGMVPELRLTVAGPAGPSQGGPSPSSAAGRRTTQSASAGRRSVRRAAV
ncbi:MAG: hypothetical protein ACXV5Q_04320 [Frankiaceae bacterium]